MDNKMLKLKKSFVKNLFNKIKNFFFKNSYLTEEVSEEKNSNKREFKNSMIVKEKITTNANIEILRNRFEEGMIKEEELSNEEIKELTNYYKKLTRKLIENN